MYLFLLGAHRFGLDGPGTGWADDPAGARFLCPVPGYDRHFTICEDLGIGMVPVPMTGEGPDMDRVEALVAGDPGVRGMWCVPRYSNPTGETYSADTVRRIAALGRVAAPGFRVMWDNAYAVHHLAGGGPPPENVMAHCRAAGTEDSVVQFASTSKVTFAGAGISFFGASRRNVDRFRSRLSVMTIGPDKVNQLRHMRLLPDMDAVHAHMVRHAELLRPKFDCVRRRLEEGLGNLDAGRWTDPAGGYFVSFWTRPGPREGDSASRRRGGGAADPGRCRLPLRRRSRGQPHPSRAELSPARRGGPGDGGLRDVREARGRAQGQASVRRMNTLRSQPLKAFHRGRQ